MKAEEWGNMPWEIAARDIVETLERWGCELVSDWHGAIWVIDEGEARPKNGDVDENYRGQWIDGT